MHHFWGQFSLFSEKLFFRLCVGMFWYCGRGEVCMISFIFMGESTNLLFNSWLISRDMVAVGVRTELFSYLRDTISFWLIVPFFLVRFVIAPIVVTKHLINIRTSEDLRSKFQPAAFPFLWTFLGFCLAPGSVPVLMDMYRDVKSQM